MRKFAAETAIQILPNDRKPESNFTTEIAEAVWDLGFEASLELSAWNLELPGDFAPLNSYIVSGWRIGRRTSRMKLKCRRAVATNEKHGTAFVIRAGGRGCAWNWASGVCSEAYNRCDFVFGP